MSIVLGEICLLGDIFSSKKCRLCYFLILYASTYYYGRINFLELICPQYLSFRCTDYYYYYYYYTLTCVLFSL